MSWFNIAKKYIKEKKIKQYQLIELFKVDTRGAVGHYLSGRRDPSIWQLKRFSDFSGLSMDYLMTEPEPEYPPVKVSQTGINEHVALPVLSESQNKWLALMYGLTEVQKQELITRAKEIAEKNQEIIRELNQQKF